MTTQTERQTRSAPEIECPACNGHGEVCGVNPNRRSRFVGHDDLSPDDFTVDCEACAGAGWDDAAALAGGGEG